MGITFSLTIRSSVYLPLRLPMCHLSKQADTLGSLSRRLTIRPSGCRLVTLCVGLRQQVQHLRFKAK